MSPEYVAERLAAWATEAPQGTDAFHAWLRWWRGEKPRRVEYVEPDGPRRTWTLWQDGRQVGMVQGRMFRDPHQVEPSYAWSWRWLGAAEELAP